MKVTTPSIEAWKWIAFVTNAMVLKVIGISVCTVITSNFELCKISPGEYANCVHFEFMFSQS